MRTHETYYLKPIGQNAGTINGHVIDVYFMCWIKRGAHLDMKVINAVAVEYLYEI